MRWLKFLFMILIPLTFGLSIYWGTRAAREADAEEATLKAIPPLEILTFRGLIPQKVVRDFERRTRIPVTLHEVSSSEDLWAHFSEGKLSFDLVTLASFQFRPALDSGRLERIDLKKLEGWNRVSADFLGPHKGPPSSSNARDYHLLPLVWGMVGRWSNAGSADQTDLWASHAQGAFKPISSGKWKFEPSDSFAPLLVISMGVSDGSPKITEIYAFLNHLLQESSSKSMSLSFREASAVRSKRNSEDEEELARLRPEFFRTFPLPKTRIDYDGKNAQRMKNYLNSKFRLKDFEWPPQSTKVGTTPAAGRKITVDPSAGP